VIYRRQFLSTLAVSGLGVLAGCSSSDGGAETESPEETTSTGITDSSLLPAEAGSYLTSTENFDGTATDMTGTDTVTIDVGAGGNGGSFAFSPVAVRIDPGTTVRWVWTGEGGFHNIVAEDGSFQSDQTNNEGFEFEQTFEEPGLYRYYCAPHESLGMKGVVLVE
jgi:halocyanin-like protein